MKQTKKNPPKKDSLGSKKSPAKSSAMQTLEDQILELTEALQRERADAINAKNRLEEEKQSISDYAKSKVVAELLPVLDAADAALKLSGQKEDSDAVVKKLRQSLNTLGLARIKAVGQEFDPELHNAVMVEEQDTEDGKELVVEDLQTGYTLDGRVLRPSMVKVSK